MQQKPEIKQISAEEISETRAKLRRGDLAIISEMMHGRYQPETIKKMFSGHRTMNVDVFTEATRLITTIQTLKTPKP